MKVRDICHGDRVAARAIVMQQKTSRPVQFEITESTREAVAAWIKEAGLRSEDYLFPSRLHESLHLSTRQYAHIVDSWVEEIGLDPADYGTHSMRPHCARGAGLAGWAPQQALSLPVALSMRLKTSPT